MSRMSLSWVILWYYQRRTQAGRLIFIYKKGGDVMQRCKHFEAKDHGGKVNCGSCAKWTGNKCRDEALLLAEWDKEHRWAEREMQQSKGVWLG